MDFWGNAQTALARPATASLKTTECTGERKSVAVMFARLCKVLVRCRVDLFDIVLELLEIDAMARNEHALDLLGQLMRIGCSGVRTELRRTRPIRWRNTFVFIPSWERMRTGRCRASCAFCDLTSCPRRPPFDNELRRILVEVHHDHLHYLTDKLFA
jgi:hypothetical protein